MTSPVLSLPHAPQTIQVCASIFQYYSQQLHQWQMYAEAQKSEVENLLQANQELQGCVANLREQLYYEKSKDGVSPTALIITAQQGAGHHLPEFKE